MRLFLVTYSLPLMLECCAEIILMVDTGRVNQSESGGWITSVHGAGIRGGHHST